MGARIGQFLATLMLSVPLSAAVLMAIFGVPPLSQVIASPELKRIVRGQAEPDAWSDLSTSQGPAPTQFEDAPAFGGTATSLSAAAPSVQLTSPLPPSNGSQARLESNGFQSATSAPGYGAPSWANATQATDAAPHSAQGGNDRAPNAMSMTSPPTNFSDIPVHSNSRTPAPFDASSQMSWRQASLRLAELGIDKYHIEPGSAEGKFLFVCVYSPADAPKVSHRFEAEADDPLIAVNQVLQQVERWMRQRFAASNFPGRANTPSSSETLFR